MKTKNFDLKKGEIALIVVSADKYLSTSMEILKHYCNDRKASCVYVTVNRSYDTLIKIFKEKKIDSDKVFVIDAISPVGAKRKEEENAIFIGSPKGLTDISISATSAIKNISNGERLLYFDSLSTLLIYNDVGSVTQFAHFLINKMKEWDISMAIITLEKETDDKLLSQMKQFVDKVIEVK